MIHIVRGWIYCFVYRRAQFCVSSFNIFLADLFFTLNNTEIANHADDTTTYVVSDDIENLI